MVEIDVVYTGQLHTDATHGPTGATLSTDAPKDNEGFGEAFSPTDLLATSFGTCMLTVMGIVARRKEWPLEGASVHIEKHMVADPVRRIGKLVAVFQMPAALEERARQALERAALTCPVHKSLHPDIEQDIRFEYA